MIENIYQYKIKKNEKDFLFLFSVLSTLPELYDVFTEMRNDIFNRMKLNEEAEKKQAEQKAESTEVKQDV